MNTKIVANYNHKGGVSKTTTTFNLASYLANHDRKVLMIDADPQCNLTQIALASVIDSADERSVTEGNIEELPGDTVLGVLNQRIKGDTAFIDVTKIKLNKISKNLHLLRGSVDLSSIEDDLAEAHVQRLSQRTNLMRTYVAVGDFITRLAEIHSADYVFIDLGPSSGALTRAFFLACDYFFVPAAPDRFNVQAVGTLSRIIDRWITEHSQTLQMYRELQLPIRPGAPAFLGMIVQAFKIYKGKPKPAFRMWESRLPIEIRSRLRPVLRKHSTDARELYLPGISGRNREIAVSIPDFGQLAPLMQEVGKAVFLLTQSDTARVSDSGKPWMGNNWTSAVDRMASYKMCFEKLASVLEAA